MKTDTEILNFVEKHLADKKAITFVIKDSFSKVTFIWDGRTSDPHTENLAYGYTFREAVTKAMEHPYGRK